VQVSRTLWALAALQKALSGRRVPPGQKVLEGALKTAGQADFCVYEIGGKTPRMSVRT
jgi:hypothetical protein